MKRLVRKGERLLKKIESHLHQINIIEAYQEIHIPYSGQFIDLNYYYFLRITIFFIKIVFHEYGINMNIPLLRRIDKADIENCDYWVFTDLSSFSFDVFSQIGWQLEEINCKKEIKKKDIKKCMKQLPDGNKCFLRFCNIIDEFEKHDDVLDYFAVLYFPGLADLEIWLQDHREGNERLLRLYKDCIEQLNFLFCEGYSNYPSFSINGTWYIPIIMGYNDTDSSDDVSMANFAMGKIFVAYALSVFYKTAIKRGFKHGCERVE